MSKPPLELIAVQLEADQRSCESTHVETGDFLFITSYLVMFHMVARIETMKKLKCILSTR